MESKTKMMDHLFRRQAGKMTSILINLFGFEHSDLIDDVVQETFLAALKNWGLKGVPENPEGWMMQVARNKLINELNRINRHGNLNQKYAELSEFERLVDEPDEVIKTEQIQAFFKCCSPELTSKSQVILALKIVSGFGDKEIAKAMLMNEQAVRKSAYRAKNSLIQIGKASLILSRDDYQERLDAVLRVLYLMFNEGYRSTSYEEVINEEISFEAIRICEWLLDLDGIDYGKVHALLALMLFNFARFTSRIDDSNQIVDIEHQERSKWDKNLINKGAYHQGKSRQSESLSRYHIECGIASAHCFARSYAETNWEMILMYYQTLKEFDNSTTVQINHSIALCESGNAQEALIQLKAIESESKKDSSQLFAAIAKVYERLKEIEMARSYYKVAIDMTSHLGERAFLENKLSLLLTNTQGSNN